MTPCTRFATRAGDVREVSKQFAVGRRTVYSLSRPRGSFAAKYTWPHAPAIITPLYKHNGSLLGCIKALSSPLSTFSGRGRATARQRLPARFVAPCIHAAIHNTADARSPPRAQSNNRTQLSGMFKVGSGLRSSGRWLPAAVSLRGNTSGPGERRDR